MHIGIAGYVSLNLLNPLKKDNNLPIVHENPHISMLINAFLKRNYRVTVYTTSEFIKKPVIIEREDLTVCIAPRMPHAARDFFKSERSELKELMNSKKADIINAHWSYEFALAALSTNIPTIVSLRDHALAILKLVTASKNSLATKSHWFIRFLMNQFVLQRSKYLSVNSEYLYNLLPLKYKNKTRIINNFYSSELELDIIPIEKKKNIMVSVSNGFGKIKNIDTAIRAFKIVRETVPDLEYYLIGDDMQKYGLTYQFAKENNIHDDIKFLGRLSFNETIKNVYNAKIFLHPSREESFGMSILESMVQGTTVIGGDKSGNVPNLLNMGKAGIICDINSPEEIAHSILTLLNNPQLNDELRMNALNFAKNNFSENDSIKKYISYYSFILSGQQN